MSPPKNSVLARHLGLTFCLVMSLQDGSMTCHQGNMLLCEKRQTGAALGSEADRALAHGWTPSSRRGQGSSILKHINACSH